MENKIEDKNKQPEIGVENKTANHDPSSMMAICILAIVVIGIANISPTPKISKSENFEVGGFHPAVSTKSNDVVSDYGVTLLVTVGNLGAQMVDTGVIDRDKFLALYASNPELKKQAEDLLVGTQGSVVKITRQNSGLLLNFFWALGLGNKNDILEKGEMMDPRYGGAGNFASTGGWIIAKGNPMDHYSAHQFFTLTPQQQSLLASVSSNIYRPCCGNSTHFPDCNHGMAMLGFLELLASQGASEKEMYQSALTLNSYWFTDTYLTIAEYMKQKGIEWKDVDPKTVLGADYSSGSGFAKISAQVIRPKDKQSGGGSCSV